MKGAAGVTQMLKQMLGKDKSCHQLSCTLSLTRVLVLCSSTLESEVPRIKPANKLTNPMFSFTLKASQTLIYSQNLLFHLHSFCLLPSLARCSSVTSRVFFFFHHWEPFLVSFYTAERAHPHKHANNWNTVWWGYWGDEKSFSEGEEECFWNQGLWSERSSMNITQKKNVFVFWILSPCNPQARKPTFWWAENF